MQRITFLYETTRETLASEAQQIRNAVNLHSITDIFSQAWAVLAVPDTSYEEALKECSVGLIKEPHSAQGLGAILRTANTLPHLHLGLEIRAEKEMFPLAAKFGVESIGIPNYVLCAYNEEENLEEVFSTTSCIIKRQGARIADSSTRDAKIAYPIIDTGVLVRRNDRKPQMPLVYQGTHAVWIA